MDIFDMPPEELSALALLISIGLSRRYTDDLQLGVLAVFFTAIGDNLGLIQLQRVTLAEKVQKVQNAQNGEKSNETSKSDS